MSKVIDKIKEIMQQKDMSVRELGRLTDIPQTSINRYLTTDDEFKIPIAKLERIAQALGVTPAYLMGWNDTSQPIGIKVGHPVLKKKIPLLGNVACGEPIFASEDHEAFIETDADMEADFCLTAKGNSMINARIFDGDTLFVKAQSMVNNGEIAVVLVDDEATVKRVYIDYDDKTQSIAMLTLIPENPTYKPMRFTGEKLNHIRVLGKVVSGQYSIL